MPGPRVRRLLHDLRMAAQKPSANPVAGGERQSHRYNPQGAAFVDVKSPTRNVRSRLYFTSESHMYGDHFWGGINSHASV